MNDRLRRIEDELEEELGSIDAALAEVDERRAELIQERDKVAGSLSELRGKSVAVKPARKRGQPRQSCATQEEVARLLTQVLQQNGPCTEADLIDLVEDELKDLGKSRMVFKVHYKRLRPQLLTATDDGRLTLASDTGALPGRTA